MKSLIKYSLFAFSNFVMAQENSFTIVGKTNMNIFKCIDKNFNTPTTFGNENSSNNKISLNITDFDCKYDYITKDFRKTLSADIFPQIQINFGKFRKSSNGNYISSAEVKLMNKVRTYNIELYNNGKTLSGKQQVRFSDFGITPPKKMAGMIVVKDELDLSFIIQNN